MPNLVKEKLFKQNREEKSNIKILSENHLNNILHFDFINAIATKSIGAHTMVFYSPSDYSQSAQGIGVIAYFARVRTVIRYVLGNAHTYYSIYSCYK